MKRNEKNTKCVKIACILLLATSIFSGCAGGWETDEYKNFYIDELKEAKGIKYTIAGNLNYHGKAPSKKWVSQTSSAELAPYNPVTVRLLLKKSTDRDNTQFIVL